MGFGERLKSLRKSKKMTQIELSRVLGVDHTTISKWESGIYETDFETAQRIAQYFGVSADYLLGKENQEVKNLTETEILDYQKIIDASRRKLEQGKPDTYRGRKITRSTLDLLEQVLQSAQKIIDDEKD